MYTTSYHSGVKYHQYIQGQNEIVTQFAQPYKETQLLKYFHVPYASCLVNSNYFVNVAGSEYGQILGRCQGINVDYRQDLDGWIDFVITKDNEFVMKNMNSWDYLDVQMGGSCAYVLIRDSQLVKEKSADISSRKFTNADTQTLFGKLKSGMFSAVVVEQGLTGSQVQQLGLSLGFVDMVMLDSGGSSEMIVGTRKTITGGRRLPCCIAFIKEKPMKIIARKQILAVRETMEFITKEVTEFDPFIQKNITRTRPVANGKIIGKLNVGEEIEIVRPVTDIAPDGWQWFVVLFNGKECYCQYDSMAYTIET